MIPAKPVYAVKVVGLDIGAYSSLIQILHQNNWKWSATGSAEEREAVRGRKRARFGRSIGDLQRAANLLVREFGAVGSAVPSEPSIVEPAAAELPSAEPVLQH